MAIALSRTRAETTKTQKPSRAGRISSPSSIGRKLVVFQLGTQSYALPLTDVREILLAAELCQMPGLPATLAGVLNLGGVAIPVLRLDRLFGLVEQAPELYTPLLLLRHSNPPLALMVEKVSEIITPAADAIMPVPADQSFNDCAEGLVMAGDRVILLLSAERLLLEKEQQYLAEFQDREQARLREWEVGCVERAGEPPVRSTHSTSAEGQSA